MQTKRFAINHRATWQFDLLPGRPDHAGVAFTDRGLQSALFMLAPAGFSIVLVIAFTANVVWHLWYGVGVFRDDWLFCIGAYLIAALVTFAVAVLLARGRRVRIDGDAVEASRLRLRGPTLISRVALSETRLCVRRVLLTSQNPPQHFLALFLEGPEWQMMLRSTPVPIINDDGLSEVERDVHLELEEDEFARHCRRDLPEPLQAKEIGRGLPLLVIARWG